MNVYPFTGTETRCRRNVKRACELLKVSRAAFYAYLSALPQRDQDDADLAAKIQAVHEESKDRYGAPRLHAVLCRRGHRHSRKRDFSANASTLNSRWCGGITYQRPPGDCRIHRLVQRHPAVQHPGLRQPRRIRSLAQKGGPRASGLTSHQPCPSKRGNPRSSTAPDWLRPGH